MKNNNIGTVPPPLSTVCLVGKGEGEGEQGGGGGGEAGEGGPHTRPGDQTQQRERLRHLLKSQRREIFIIFIYSPQATLSLKTCITAWSYL